MYYNKNMPTKKKLGGKISYKRISLDTSGLGYQRAKEIESIKAQQASDEKLNRALDAILRKENITKPSMQEKQEAYKKLMDDTANKIITSQKNDLLRVSTDLLSDINKPKLRKPRVPRTTIKDKVLLNSPATFKSEALPPAILPPTTYPDYVGDIKNIVKQGTKKLKVYEDLTADNLAPRLSKPEYSTIILSPSTPMSMPQVMSSKQRKSKTTLDLRGFI
jgi:hypothetical protein